MAALVSNAVSRGTGSPSLHHPAPVIPEGGAVGRRHAQKPGMAGS